MKMSKINPKHIESLIEMINQSPYLSLLSMKIREIGAGFSRAEVDLENKHMNPFGALHGGVYSSLIDTAAYWSAYCEIEENAGFTSIDLNVNNLAMITAGKIIAQGRSIKIGKTLCLTEATVRDETGRILAHGTSKLMILQGKQSIRDAVKIFGYDALPPKFI